MIGKEKRELVVKLVSGLTKGEWLRIRSRVDALFEKRTLKVRLEGNEDEAILDQMLRNEWDMAIPERSESDKDLHGNAALNK